MPAKADTRVVSDKVGKNWRHKETKFVFPGTVAGFTLKDVADSTDSESDLTATYRDDATKSLLTIFVFRAGISNVSIWQDRVTGALTSGQSSVGKVASAVPLTALFTPDGGVKDSGSLVVFELSDAKARSTGSAMMPMGSWLLAIRVTSFSLSSQDLFARMQTLIAELKLPASANSQIAEPAYLIERCQSDAPATEAARTPGGMEEAVAASLFGSVTAALENPKQEVKGTRVPSPPYCRENYKADNFSVYSRSVTRDGYVLALGDAGLTVTASPSMDLSNAKGAPIYAITMRSTTEALFFRGFKTLPSISQVVAVVNGEAPIAKIGRTPKTSGNINIIMPEQEKK